MFDAKNYLAILVLLLTAASSRAAETDLTIVHASDLSSWQALPVNIGGAILVSPGGTLCASSEARRTGGSFAVDCLAADGFQAVNLVPADFATGLAVTAPLLKKGPFLSANLRDRAGNRVAAASVVIDSAGRKIGITGVAAAPLPDDPSAKAFSAELTAADPIVNLKDVAADLVKTSDIRVLLVYGSPIMGAKILRAYPQFQVCITANGSAEPEVVRVGAAALVASPAGGQAFGVTVLPAGNVAAARSEIRAARLAITAKIEKVYVQHQLTSNPLDSHPALPVAPAAPQSPLADRLPDDGVMPMNRSASNRGAKMTVTMFRLAKEYGAAKPQAGSSFLVVTTSWENIIPLTLIAERQIPTVYLVPKLTDNLYLVVNGTRLAPLATDAASLPGHLEIAPFEIDRLGQVVTGNLVFELPPVAIQALELRFYDFAHGHFTLPLVGNARAADKPLNPAKKNEVVEAALYGVEKPATFGGVNPPPEMQFVAVDMRARSVVVTESDATAFDPKAAKGAKLAIGTVADWNEARKYAQVVVDGEYAFLPLDSSDLPEAPRFLPDLFTGGNLVFLVPRGAKSLELRCDFPNAALPDGTTIRPKAIVFPLVGQRPAIPEPKAAASAKDGIFSVWVTGQRVAGDFAGAKADDDHKFLILDVTVRNAGSKQQEFFVPKDQLKYVAESGDKIDLDDASLKGIHPPLGQIYIPPGEVRSFQAAYQIPADQTQPRLEYAAVTEGAGAVIKLAKIVKGLPAAQNPVAQAKPSTPEVMPAKTPVAVATGNAPTPAPSPVPAPAPKPAEPAVDNTTSPRVTAKQDRKPLGIAGVGLTAEQVNTAIEKGSAALWSYVKKKDLADGQNLWGPPEDTLVVLALVHCDYQKKNPEFNAALRTFLQEIEPRKIGVYRAGILQMIIEGYGDVTYLPKMRDTARFLLESQFSDGTYAYFPDVPEAIFEQAAARRGVVRVEGGAPIGKPPEPWTRLTKPIVDTGDSSVTQYALLGLNSASRAGMKMPAETWESALKLLRGRQNENGGWAYKDPGADSYGSMTAAGICGMAIARFELGEASPAVDPSIERGLGWMDANFAVDKHPGDETEWYYYYMYSMERVGRILDTEFIGSHEWYPLGAAALIPRQGADWLWTGNSDEADQRLASSFALLFLTRATPALNLRPRTGGPGFVVATAAAPPNKMYIILDCSGSMIDMMDGQMKFDVARGAVWSMIKELPENSEVALRVYGHRKSSLEPESDLDTELLIPPGPLNKDDFKAKLDGLHSRGKTPLALSLEEAMKEITDGDARHPVTLVLLTDGGEDTFPRRNPVKTAALLKDRKDIRFHLVGFDINQQDWADQLQAMATASGADYWPAAKAADLNRNLQAAVLGTPAGFDVLDAAGQVVTSGTFGTKIKLAEGKYSFRAALAGRSFTQEFWVNTDTTTSIEFDGQSALDALASASELLVPAANAPPPPVSAPRFCTHCGAPLQPGQKFCTKCGTKVGP